MAQSRRSPVVDRDRSRLRADRDGHSSGGDGGRRPQSPDRRRSPHRGDGRPSREDDRQKRRSKSPGGRRERRRSPENRKKSPVQRRRSPAERKHSPDHRRKSLDVRKRRSASRDEGRRDGKRTSPERERNDKGRRSPDRAVRVCNSRYERPREKDHSPFESDLKKELERVHKVRK